MACRNKSPYKKILTHGFVLDEKGLKMSKSLGNILDPLTIIMGGKDIKNKPPLGAETLRFWAAGVDYTNDVCVGENIMKNTSENLKKLRNSLRFLIGNLFDFNPYKQFVIA